ncbi:MAG: hypothetical protein AAF329_25690, partial [Cyanobacteria bacterium P01_A01_bin.17]
MLRATVVVGHISKSFLRRYLMGLPQSVRVARYHGLSRVAWLKSALAEIRPEVLPETSPAPDAEPPAEPDYIQPPTAYYHQYRCLQGNPLSCSLNCQSPANCQSPTNSKSSTNYQSPSGEEQTQCEHCNFPAWLPEQGQLVG